MKNVHNNILHVYLTQYSSRSEFGNISNINRVINRVKRFGTKIYDQDFCVRRVKASIPFSSVLC